MAEPEWKPKILGIVCNWCSYAGADLAGSARTQYPPTSGSSVSCAPAVSTRSSS